MDLVTVHSSTADVIDGDVIKLVTSSIRAVQVMRCSVGLFLARSRLCSTRLGRLPSPSSGIKKQNKFQKLCETKEEEQRGVQTLEATLHICHDSDKIRKNKK